MLDALVKKQVRKVILYVILIAVSIVMLYPMLWLFGASFKSNADIHSSIWFMPKSFSAEPYRHGWVTGSEYTMGHYFLNTFKMVIPTVIFTIVSSVLTAYGFARFEFPGKKVLFSLLIATMLLPVIILRIPQYVMWGWFRVLDTYTPLVLPHLFASDGVFVFLLIQFFRSIPKDLDEAAKIDGCSRINTLIRILVPVIKPGIVSIGLFSFMWSMNDFIGPLIYISSVKKYPVTIALRMSMDATGNGYDENQIIAMSVISLIPSIIVFALGQKQFVEGLTTGSLKG
ncbi:L-arabinose transport system permease protein AraQ [Caprobacter fermentans]|nr:carbohydrate ABC transporter permease [Caproicibacter fermentans]MVB10525.1 L-arabinose transport system permease protein AraQ [Caproicibacter fermentans]